MQYKIHEICGDWALDIHTDNCAVMTLYFNSRQNALFAQKILQLDEAGIVCDKTPVVRCINCRFWHGAQCKWRQDETPLPYDYCSYDEHED